MKLKLNTDEELVNNILAALKENNNYCPCVIDSKGKQEYKCPCRECREDLKVGEQCHCGLYTKVE